MKKTFLLALSMLLAGLFTIQKAQAQVFDGNGEVRWLGTEISDTLVGKYVYLYDIDRKRFLNAGSEYGVQCVLDEVGMRFVLQKPVDTGQSSTTYLLKSLTTNPMAGLGSYVSPSGNADGNGATIYIDRGNRNGTYSNNVSHPNWEFVSLGADSPKEDFYVDERQEDGSVVPVHYTYDTHTYYLRNTNGTNWWVGYTYTNPTYFASLYNSTTNRIRWRIVTEDDYVEAMNNITIGEVNLGAFVQDPTFQRYNVDGAYWEWRELSTNPTQTGELIDPVVSPETGVNVTPDEYNGQTLEQLTGNSGTLTGNPLHWYQRNQNWMLNAQWIKSPSQEGTYLYLTDNNANGRRNRVGWNLDWDGTGNLSFNAMWKNYAKYFAAEIYNEAIEFSQQLRLSEQEHLRGGLYRIQLEALYDNDGDHNTNLTNNGLEEPNSVFFYRITDKNGKVTYREFPIPVIGSANVGTGAQEITPHSGISAGRELIRDASRGIYGRYRVEAYMYLQAEATVRVGIRVKEAHGWTVLNNVHLYTLGQTPLLLNENWYSLAEAPGGQIEYYQNKNPKTLPGDPYWWTTFPTDWSGKSSGDLQRPTTVYYTRTMTKGAWNTICLPFALNSAQIKAAFGSDCKLSVFEGLDGNCIKFTTAKDADGNKWNESSKFEMVIGKPYLIKPTVDPQILNSTPGTPDSYKIPWSRATVESGNYVEIESPAYTIPDMTFYQTYQRPEGDETSLPTAKTDEGTGGIDFVGNFYTKTIERDEVYCEDAEGNTVSNGNANYWVITHGDMYHLQGTRDWKVWATYAYLTAPRTMSSSVQSIAIEDGDTYINTAVEGLVIDYDGTVGNNKVYTLGGQKVSGDSSISNLKKGVYIMNGKKYVVR